MELYQKPDQASIDFPVGKSKSEFARLPAGSEGVPERGRKEGKFTSYFLIHRNKAGTPLLVRLYSPLAVLF